VWRTDVRLAPVFTALMRLVSRIWRGPLAGAAGAGDLGARRDRFLAAGLAAVANRRAALIGSALLATNYAFVMWNRAALWSRR
jgi:hypothetical protein